MEVVAHGACNVDTLIRTCFFFFLMHVAVMLTWRGVGSSSAVQSSVKTPMKFSHLPQEKKQNCIKTSLRNDLAPFVFLVQSCTSGGPTCSFLFTDSRWRQIPNLFSLSTWNIHNKSYYMLLFTLEKKCLELVKL